MPPVGCALSDSGTLSLGKMSQSDVHFYIGLSLALVSTIFIGCSFIVKKIALRRLAATGTRAGKYTFLFICH